MAEMYLNLALGAGIGVRTDGPDVVPYLVEPDPRNPRRSMRVALDQARFLGMARRIIRGQVLDVRQWEDRLGAGPVSVRPHRTLGESEKMIVSVMALACLCPDLLRYRAECPGCMEQVGVSSPVTDLVIHLNDTHEWTREAIADWMDTLPIDQSILVTQTPGTPVPGERKENG